MIESSASLLPRSEPGKLLRVLCIGFDEDSLEEMDRLLVTLGVEPAGRVLVHLRKIHPATYLGQGKLEESKLQIEELLVDSVVVDTELSPNQLRNIEKILGKPVIDRPGVIIEIFSRHARTKESKTQVELARLQYLLPRLAHFWTHFERQRGGIGQKGMGEKQIEVDRRLVGKRMEILRARLKAIEKERNVQRAGRKDILKVAVVGYTNAGKSTLLNQLTQSQVLAEDKLFATLDASVRSLDPNSHPPVVAIDTVGFIDHLPPSLIASFRATLEELHEADLLLHVVDAHSAQAKRQLDVTEVVLKDLGLEDKPRLVALNKWDLLKTPGEKNLGRLIAPGGIPVSALNPDEVASLRDRVLDHFRKKLQIWEVVVPYSESKIEAKIHAHGAVEKTKHLEQGTFFRVRIHDSWAKKLGLEKFRP